MLALECLLSVSLCLSGAIREVATEHDRDSLLAGTMPFAPFIALGTLVAFVA